MTLDQLAIEHGYKSDGWPITARDETEKVVDILDRLCLDRLLTFDDLHRLPALDIARMVIHDNHRTEEPDADRTNDAVTTYFQKRAIIP